MDALRFVHNAITHSHLRTAFICLQLIVILTLFPSLLLLICEKQECANILHIEYSGISADTKHITTWLFISIIVAIPMAFIVLLDIPKQIFNAETRDIIIYRIILVVVNIVPALICYYSVEYDGHLMQSLRYALRDIQVLFTITSLQLTMFCSHIKILDPRYRDLKQKLGNLFMYFLTSLVISRLCFVLEISVFYGSSTFQILAALINFSNTLISYISYFYILHYIVKEKYFTSSNSDDSNKRTILDVDTKFSDQFHCIALVLNTFFNVAVTLFFYNDLFLHLYAQIFLILMMTAIPLECNLLQAEIKEEKLSAKLNMLRYVSHEMRTPLNIAILGSKVAMDGLIELSIKIGEVDENIDDLMSKPLISISQNLLNNVYMRIKDVMELSQQDVSTLDDVLTFDKLDEKKLTLEKQRSYNPYMLLESVIADSAAVIREANLNISLQCVPAYDTNWLDGVQLHLDECKITQVLRNLIFNAVKFTPSHGQIILILEKKEVSSLSSSSSSIIVGGAGGGGGDCSSFIRISVSDTGQGIAPEVLKHMLAQYAIYDPEAPQDKRSKCAGLGLWISKCKSYTVLSCSCNCTVLCTLSCMIC